MFLFSEMKRVVVSTWGRRDLSDQSIEERLLTVESDLRTIASDVAMIAIDTRANGAHASMTQS